MSDPVLVVGAGLAGLAAATELARAGLLVVVAEQAPAPGGAIHRQPLEDVGRPIASAEQQRRWESLMAEVRSNREWIEIRCNTRFAGIDHQGTALLTGMRSCLMRPSALVLAMGATERVRPRPGWTLPGVMTAGAIQTQTKALGAAPRGRIVLAGSGPLLLAAAANLVDGGNPPVAVIEAALPFSRAVTALALPRGYLREATGYLTTLLRARVPILTGADLVRIDRQATGLRADVETSRGTKAFEADLIGLHDGIRPNDYGAISAAVPVVRAGDCREVLGARAALADGRGAGAALAAALAGKPPTVAKTPELASERAAQRRLARLYAHDDAARLAGLHSETVICRCENRTLGDLRALGTTPTERELRLTGRFAMGRCQGRFCAEWVRALTDTQHGATQIGAMRLPVRPITIADLIAAEDHEDQSATGEKP